MPRAPQPEQLDEHAGPSKNVDNRSRVRHRRRNTGQQDHQRPGKDRGEAHPPFSSIDRSPQISWQYSRQGKMVRPVSSSNRERAAAAAAPSPTQTAGPGSVRRHRLRGIFQLILGLAICIEPILGFRGPHHPKSSVSHHHYVPVKSVKITQDEELLHDAAHLVEDMGGLAEQIDVSKMNAQELEFYYFRVHDIDNNTKLDGLELLHALQHTRHGDDVPEDAEQTNEVNHEHGGDENSMLDYAWIVELIDRVLDEDDLDNDGYLGYIEYVLGRQKDQDERANRDGKLKV